MTIPTVPAEALDALVASGASLAVAESLTGGRLAAALTGVPGASRVFRGGVVAYASDVKVAVLGVPSLVVETDGVVSARCAAAMAAGVRRLLGATWGVATTGVAGPDPQEGHPPGTVFVGIAGPTGPARAQRLHLAGDRAAVQDASVAGALALLLSEVSRLPRDETAIG
ncbi:nicotinamide-nucleotide amidohydrolase family protein [Nocardioides sp. ChNu-153]|uniref:CinA family protein n=1 Tax=unclassified Nocardioides TaxID=2615069 RepID=UPI002405A46F|nr:MULTISPECIES: nicotinamide-nucleotide amidohydrolase family protein [unclassified Nocardioides]MDF9717583.1 nicotinamide-nucleotide amidohydrolase family protein [Nocardioides sp. ChNu-99]MDN7121714.1 nicotinamide-nucleotide amidohydrolase family protein [Nocardioides sp. ChNu-153]